VSADVGVALAEIVRRHGETVLSERSRLFALLRDHAPGDLRAVRVAMAALDAGAPARLKAAAPAALPQTVAAETGQLVDLYGIQPDLARAAISTWAAFSRSGAALSGAAANAPRPLPLPLPPGGAAAVQPLPPAADANPAQPGQSRFARWATIAGAVLLLLASLLRLLGSL
jgi:hypothetical protein